MAVILLALEGTSNQGILDEWLTPQHEICSLLEGLVPDRSIDLIIVDSAGLDRFGVTIAQRIRSATTLLPLLLIVPRPRPGLHIVTPNRPGIALPQLWREANELITVPISKHELEVRIAILLALRDREKGLYEARELLRLASELAQLTFWEWDADTGEVNFPLAWSRQLGYPEALPNRVEELYLRMHPDELGQVTSQFDSLRSGRHADFEVEFRLKQLDGSYRWFQSKVALIHEQAAISSRLVISQLDITAQKEMQERIRQISQHDMLTGLPNRALLYEFGEHVLARARRSGTSIAFLFFDLDHFKSINDTYGHHVGDQLLQQVAQRILQSIRGEDFVCRLGGDEFLAVVTPIRQSRDAALIAQHALDRLAQPYLLEGREIICSPSIGISLFPQDGEAFDLLIQHADDAMYCAKQAGCSNFQFFAEALNEKSRASAMLENRLRNAIEHNEFRLFYQPVFDTESAAIVGVEVLIRWPASTGLAKLDPAVFIPLAESIGLIQRLGTWIFEEACRQHKQWIKEGLPAIALAINVSFAQFRSKDFAQDLGQVLASARIAPNCLSLELTENTLMSDTEGALRRLAEIRRIGITVALDAFGTGSSNLSQLGRLRLDKIKIDRSVIHNLDKGTASSAVVEAAIALGKALDIRIVAGGVETVEMLQLVKRRQCHQAQGFYFCQPLPGDEFRQWYRGHAQTMQR